MHVYMNTLITVRQTVRTTRNKPFLWFAGHFCCICDRISVTFNSSEFNILNHLHIVCMYVFIFWWLGDYCDRFVRKKLQVSNTVAIIIKPFNSGFVH